MQEENMFGLLLRHMSIDMGVYVCACVQMYAVDSVNDIWLEVSTVQKSEMKEKNIHRKITETK